MVSLLAPVSAEPFFENSAWTDYDDMASYLMMKIDSMIEAEKGAAQ
ncbi:hypothetical protein ACR9GP_25280 [Enterobacter ludwigii]